MTAAVNELVIPAEEQAQKHIVMNENVGYELLVRNEGGGPFTWIARERVFEDGTIELSGPGGTGTLQGL